MPNPKRPDSVGLRLYRFFNFFNLVRISFRNLCCLAMKRPNEGEEMPKVPPFCICNANVGDPHPVFPDTKIYWASYKIKISHKQSQAGDFSVSTDLGDPQGCLCDICNRTMPLYGGPQYFKLKHQNIAKDPKKRADFLVKRDEYLQNLLMHNLEELCSCAVCCGSLLYLLSLVFAVIFRRNWHRGLGALQASGSGSQTLM